MNITIWIYYKNQVAHNQEEKNVSSQKQTNKQNKNTSQY